MPAFETQSAEETLALGRRLAAEVARPAWILLQGNLGAGKTTLAKGMVAALTGLSPEEITSPTFTLVHEYGHGVFHLDLYRLETNDEVLTLPLEELQDDPSAVVLVEWGERFPGLMPKRHQIARLEDLGGDRRRVYWETAEVTKF